MLTILRTDSSNSDFQSLVRLLDADLAIRDGEDHSFYSQFNKIDQIKYVVLAFIDNQAVSCGAIKQYASDTMEVKRMFTLPDHRGKGIASHLLEALETWATEMQYARLILETGNMQPEAIALYQKCGYQRIPNYGQYEQVENSLCFQKELSYQN